jgi:hypothetical protein
MVDSTARNANARSMLNTSITTRFPYPYEELADHMRAMKTVREWEDTSRFGHLGKAQSTQANISRVVEYFSDTYADSAEALHKAELFLSICDYIGRNESLFVRKAMLEKDEDGSFSVEPFLLRAVHHLFTAGNRAGTFDPRKILPLAKAFKTFDGEV